MVRSGAGRGGNATQGTVAKTQEFLPGWAPDSPGEIVFWGMLVSKSPR